MSNWNEQTLIFKTEDKEKFIADCAANDEICNECLVYEGEDICIAIYDSNGDGIFYQGKSIPYIAVEIMYGRNDRLTEWKGKDTRWTIKTIVKKYIKDKKVLEYVLSHINYSTSVVF